MKQTPQPKVRPTDDAKKDDPALQGEGNYTAARRHRESAEQFVQSGQVESAADAAKPKDAAEARELEAAEKAGREPARR